MCNSEKQPSRMYVDRRNVNLPGRLSELLGKMFKALLSPVSSTVLQVATDIGYEE